MVGSHMTLLYLSQGNIQLTYIMEPSTIQRWINGWWCQVLLKQCLKKTKYGFDSQIITKLSQIKIQCIKWPKDN